jgi:glycogen debranching enzyme
MIDRFWAGDRFVALDTRTQLPIESDSLLTLMPVVLGAELPSEQFELSVRRLLEGGYLTDHGVASEPVTSPRYVPDGYWRGPVWAPTTMLLIDGLRRGGREDIAADIARRFIDTCAAAGMAENFDALSGAGLRDLSMTWTASVYLALLASPPTPASAVELRTEIRARP